MVVFSISANLQFICCVLPCIACLFAVTVADIADQEQKLQCIDGTFHKGKPSAETEQLSQCQPWQNLSCCSANYTAELASNKTRALYLHGWHGCGKLSQKCMEFWFAQKCFYQCSPFIYPWKNSDHRGSIKGVPICSDYCDDWFHACKDDIICVADPLIGMNSSAPQKNICTQNPNCTMYSAAFRDGKGLCTKLWDTSYVYQKPNLDRSNCMEMWFNGSNPNKNVKPERKDHTGLAVASTLHAFCNVLVFVTAAFQF